MKTPLAWCNLCQDKLRTLVATGGVAFALTLVFVELGFLGSVTNTASLVLDQFDFDIAIVARGYRNLIDAGTFPRLRLYEAQSVPGVARTTPLYVGVQGWRSERDRPEDHHFHLGKRRPILVLGFPAGNQPFRFEIDGRPFPIQVVHQDLARLRRVDTLLLDLQSHPSFEPRQRGREVEVGGRKLRIEGLFSLGTGFASDGTILVSDETFRNLFDGYPLERVSLGLVRLADNRTSAVESVKQRLRQILIREIPGRPLVGREDIGILTRGELIGQEINYWIWKKSIGLTFLFGVGVAVIVGLVVVYQVLSSDIMDHFREYATLKAMGYTNRYLASVVIQEALMLALFGYLPAYLAAQLLYLMTRNAVNLPMNMTAERAIGVMVLSFLVCGTAALLSVRKVAASDPASLF